jgi:chitinase
MSKILSYPFLLFLSISFTLFFQSNAGSLVVYWGQNNDDGYLVDTCNTGFFQIVNLAFLSSFGNGNQPELNLAGHCTPPNCQKLRDSINHCQSIGIKIILSIGGEYKGKYSLSSPEDANQVADYIWNNFLGGNSNSRPFGDAILDGVDFDIEGGSNLHYSTLAIKLNDHYKSDSRKKYYLTAAPIVPFKITYFKGHFLLDFLTMFGFNFTTKLIIVTLIQTIQLVLRIHGVSGSMLPLLKIKMFLLDFLPHKMHLMVVLCHHKFS